MGKTTLGEALLFSAGATQRVGRVENGTSVLDFEPEEIRRHFTISTAFHSLSWKKCSLNLIDTPGYSPFLPDAINCMRAFGGSVFLLSPSDGVKVETEKLWGRANDINLSRLIFISKMEREKENFKEALDGIFESLEMKGVPLQLPVGVEDGFKGVVDLLTMKAFLFDGDTGKFSTTEIPEDLKKDSEELRVQLVESVAETDDALLEKYLDSQELSFEEIKKGIQEGTRTGKIFPILFGSALRQIGIPQLLDAIIDYLPSPLEEPTVQGKNPVTGEMEERSADPKAPFSAYIFKTLIDPFVGKLSVMRVISGKMAPDMAIYNPNKEAKEKIGHMFRLVGKKQEAIKEATAGEIVAVAKLKEALSGHTLCLEKSPIQFDGLAPFTPLLSFALEPKTKADEEKAPQGLHRMIEEDPTLDMHRDEQTREFLLSGMGQLHIEVVVEKLKRKYGAEVKLKAPKVPYKETIKARSSAQGKYKKQTGGHGQYGDTWVKIEPLPRGKGFEFVNEIVGGAIPRNYIPAVEKGAKETMSGGYLAGYPMVDIRMTLFDGSYHDVDSSDMAFKIAGSMGFKIAVEKAKPVLLEPIMSIEVAVPDDCVGDVIGDLNSRRGRVSGVETKGHTQTIKAHVPMAEVLKYAQDIHAMTSGRGGFQMEFSSYEELPAHLAEKVIKEAKGKIEAEDKD